MCTLDGWTAEGWEGEENSLGWQAYERAPVERTPDEDLLDLRSRLSARGNAGLFASVVEGKSVLGKALRREFRAALLEPGEVFCRFRQLLLQILGSRGEEATPLAIETIAGEWAEEFLHRVGGDPF